MGIILLLISLLVGISWCYLARRLLPFSFHDNGRWNNIVITTDMIVILVIVSSALLGGTMVLTG